LIWKNSLTPPPPGDRWGERMIMVKVMNKKTGEIVLCPGVWATNAERSFATMEGTSMAWGYGEEYPLTPTEKNFIFGKGYVRLKINDGWEFIPDLSKKLRRQIEDVLKETDDYDQLVLIAGILKIEV
jgi:hypothetical protein